MATEFETGPYVTDVERLPRPGAAQLHYLDWVPTLDGEPIGEGYSHSHYRSREQALVEAIKWVKHRAGLAFEIELGRASGCVLSEWTVLVESVAEARDVILRHAMPDAEGRDRESGTQGPGSRREPTWEDLAEHEDIRRYDPNNPGAGMRCSYSRSEVEMVEGVGGMLWPVSDHAWATAPPEVWDHPADQPAGLDNGNNNGNNPDDDLQVSPTRSHS